MMPVTQSMAQIEGVPLNGVTGALLAELEPLLSLAYYDSKMYPRLLDDLAEAPEVFQLFTARQDGRLVGVWVIETKPHSFIDYLGYPPVHGKRFCVHPDFRGRGIGRQLLETSKAYCFGELGLQVIFGESSEAGAIALYSRAGAMFLVSAIEAASSRNSPAENTEHFRLFVSDPRFRRYRFQAAHGLPFVIPRDEAIANTLRARGYATFAEL